jgi:diguanylate cyclase (GGDEF)-like protein
MDTAKLDLREMHWMMDMFQSIDVGIIVLDRDYRVQVWNSFMQNHTGQAAANVIGQPVFGLLTGIPEDWLRRKVESVLTLNGRAFSTWEQRPHLFACKNTRPVSGLADSMYQNVTFVPLMSADGRVGHVGLIVYDVTDIAVNQIDLEAANRQLETLSRTDRLTGLYNRGFWEESAAREFARVRRTQRPCTLMMFDIDHFKKINDGYGHPAGDDVIRATAATVRELIRTTDLAGRYGGEEFAVLLIDTALEPAVKVAERLRERIQALTVQHAEHAIRYTVSLGLAAVGPEMPDYKAWLGCADAALYDSKRGGRNRVTAFRSAPA